MSACWDNEPLMEQEYREWAFVQSWGLSDADRRIIAPLADTGMTVSEMDAFLSLRPDVLGGAMTVREGLFLAPDLVEKMVDHLVLWGRLPA